MKKLLLLSILTVLLGVPRAEAQFSNGCQQFLELWYAADTGLTYTGAGVTAWADRETAATIYNLSNTSGVNSTLPARTADALNGYPVVSFDGGDHLLNTSVFGGDFKQVGSMSLYVVANKTSDGRIFSHSKGSTRVVWKTDEFQWGGAGANNTATFNTAMGSSYEVRTMVVTIQIPGFTTQYRDYTNARLTTTVSPGASVNVSSTNDSLVLGLRNGTSFVGNLAEIMAYQNDHNTASATRQRVTSYLSLKYGISKDNSGGNLTYSNRNGNDLWPYSTNCGGGTFSSFSNRITGIFRDDCFGTIQHTKSVNSASGAVVTGALTDNGGTFSSPNGFDQNYQAFLWGDDNGALTFTNASDVPTGSGLTRVARRWKVKETVNTTLSGSIGDITYEFDLSGTDLPNNRVIGDIFYIIDTDGDGVFTDETALNPTSWNGTTKIGQFTANFDDCEMFTFAITTTALPVTWSHFDVAKQGEHIALDWGTSLEINNSHFEVEKSLDGSQWEVIGSVVGKGNYTGASEYHFTDHSPALGINYYRIKQVDYNGEASHSIEKDITFIGQNDLVGSRIFPNPTSESMVNVEMPFNADPVNVSITTMVGAELLRTQLTADKGSIDISSLDNGIYLVVLEKGDNRHVHRLVVK